MLEFILIIIGYLVCTLWAYLSARACFKSGCMDEPDGVDIFLVFCPIANIFYALANMSKLIEISANNLKKVTAKKFFKL
ncbi:hypothetical protein [Shouchella clausii]|uniref:hypothetical protein n=1 Tax=Shouchella clausii TaxID=79880 RepID=UPI001C739B54|nr:hypothetical protein [Shouchella clausii]MBX0320290.1 hypothetical protein [Shouchella clausii]MEB5480947.1 hypothetical protein [Shouchella clausii]